MATQPTSVTQYQTGIAPELAPYMQRLLGQQAARMYTYEKDAKGNPVMVGPEGQPLTQNKQGQYVDASGAVVTAAEPKISGFQPYEQYERAAAPGVDARSRVAGLTELQTGSLTAAKKLGYDPTTEAAASGIQRLAQQAGNTSYAPLQTTNVFQAPQAYQTGQFSPNQVQAPELKQFEMGPAERVSTESFKQPGTAESYMSPYMQNVIDMQKREAQRTSDIAGQTQQAEAVGRGAFGGSRDALMRAERERNLNRQLGDIQATGSQSAYQQAQQQFNAEQNARLAAQQANQQAGLTTGQQNLQAQLGIQQLGAGQNLQAQLANQQQGMTAQQLQEQSRQFGAGQGMTSAQLAAQYGLSADQLAEQSRQYGAGLGLQGLQTGLSGYGQMAGVGQNLYGQNIGNITLQNQLGTQQQQQNQNVATAQYQDWLAKQNYAQQQMDTMASYIRGTPVATQSVSQYTAAPSNLSQIVGIGTAGAGAYGMYNAMNPQQQRPPYKKGGAIKAKKNNYGGLEALAMSKLG